jgi:nascent polypeptide-associated complex subunit alpha
VIPGARNPRQLQMMMKQLGMTTEPVEGVEEVVIRTRGREEVFERPEVTVLTVRGVRTYQVIGESKSRARSTSEPTPIGAGAVPAAAGPPEEDIQLVMEQAGVDRSEALDALERSGGAPAEAILSILSRRGGSA